MHPACPNKKQNHLQNSFLRRTQFWVRKTFSKPASLKRASLSRGASLKPKRCASATLIQQTSKNEPELEHGPKNGTAWRSHFWDRMHRFAKEKNFARTLRVETIANSAGRTAAVAMVTQPNTGFLNDFCHMARPLKTLKTALAASRLG